MKWLKTSNWSEGKKRMAVIIGAIAVFAITIGAIGRATLENDYLSRMTFTATGGRTVVTGIDNIVIGANTPSTGAFTTLTDTGQTTLGIGVKHNGYIVSDAVEYLSTDTNIGTLTTIAVNGSETVFLEADVVGQAGTSTERVAYKIASAFDRDGAADVVNVGSNTKILMVNKTGMTGDCVYFTPETTNDTVHINVVSSIAKKVQWAGTVRRLSVTTTGGE